MSENQVVNSCLRYLIMLGVFAWRNNSGAYKTESGNYIRYGCKGSPDIIGMNKAGKWIGIECKSGKNQQQESQKAFQQRVEANSGIYIVARSVDDLHARQNEIVGRI
jgi:hypothetical protein